ncbi:MAG TPA: hypothetical protein ENO03_05930 [Candidatus Aminicenantes bacterium]|nr:hypothetical protein [Candidatus Aminicenantes bacterium]
MVATETVKTVLLVLLGLSILWIIIIVVRNDMQTIVRALIVAALLGLGLYYVSSTKLETLSFRAIKEDLFPVKARAYTYAKREGYVAGSPTTTFVFEDPGPPLSLAMMDGGKYMAIRDVRSVNVVLEYLGLPPVEEGVPELAAMTGKTLDADKYRWDDYAKGILLLERGICRDMTAAQTFPCIARITVTYR